MPPKFDRPTSRCRRMTVKLLAGASGRAGARIERLVGLQVEQADVVAAADLSAQPRAAR